MTGPVAASVGPVAASVAASVAGSLIGPAAPDRWQAAASVACALYGLLVGQLVPAIVARVPEPDEPAADKPSYAALAARPGLRWRASVACGVAGGLVGGGVGFGASLGFLLYLVPVGAALAVIDWHTRLLPTKVIAPSYVAVAALVGVAAWSEGDVQALLRAVIGWVAAFVFFFVLWFVYPPGMGYGDVRLSGIIGLALGYLGWSELVLGLFCGFLAGGVGGVLLSLLRIVDRRAYPFGPFMLVGAVAGVVSGPAVAAWYL